MLFVIQYLRSTFPAHYRNRESCVDQNLNSENQRLENQPKLRYDFGVNAIRFRNRLEPP